MANLLITTTPLLDDIKVHQYIGPVTANLVLGVNFFSDFAASITDVFGGNSDTYQNKLDGLTTDVNKLIRDKAFAMGANAIIDYKLQFNEISGKGKQMFMVTATGTACRITMPKQETIEKSGQITYSAINRQCLVQAYRNKLNSLAPITPDDWEIILSNNLSELAPELTKEYFRRTAGIVPESSTIIAISYTSKYEEYLSRLDKDLSAKNIYPYIDSDPTNAIKLVIKYNLFNPKIILEQLDKGNLSAAIELLNSHKDYYTDADLTDMRQIITRLDSLPDVGSVEVMVVKNGMFSKKEEEMYICPQGHLNPKDTKFCNDSYCGLDIKGLTAQQHETINQFKSFTTVLGEMLK